MELATLQNPFWLSVDTLGQVAVSDAALAVIWLRSILKAANEAG